MPRKSTRTRSSTTRARAARSCYSALELADKIRSERYASGWNVYAAQASDGDAFGADPARSARFLRERLLPATRYYTYLELAAPRCAGPLVDAVGRVRAGRRSHAGISRCAARRAATRSTRCSASSSEGQRNEHCQRPLARRRLGFRAARALRRGDRRGRRRVRARHVSQPDRDHHVRADARRLRHQRTAGRLSALVVRQGVHPQRAGLPARHAGPRLRDRDQLQSVHRVPDGREHDDDAGAGHRARVLRPQLVLQGQPPVPAVDRRRRDPRLPGVRAPLRDGMRGAARRRRGRGGARRLPRADAARRRPLPPAGAR